MAQPKAKIRLYVTADLGTGQEVALEKDQEFLVVDQANLPGNLAETHLSRPVVLLAG